MTTVSKVMRDIDSLDKSVRLIGQLLSASRNGVGDTFAVDQDTVDMVFSAFGLTQHTLDEMWQVSNSVLTSMRTKLSEAAIDM